MEGNPDLRPGSGDENPTAVIRRLEQRLAAAETNLQALRLALIDGLIVESDEGSLLLLQEAQNALQRSHEQLEERVSQRTAELQTANARLRESEFRFRTMADGTPVLIWVTDVHGSIEFVNQAYIEFFGRAPAGPAGEKALPFILGDDPERTRSFTECLRHHTPFVAESRVQRSDGEWRWLASSGRPRFSGDGEFMGMLGSSFDFTQQRQTQEQLEAAAEQLKRSNQALEDFATMASHDLQEPIRKIKNFGDLLLNGKDQLTDDQRDWLGRMTHAAVRMQKLTEDLLELSRLAKQEIVTQPVDLEQLVTEIVAAMCDSPKQGCGEVKIGALPRIHADPVQMHQLFSNLMSNALKFHRPDVAPQIRVYAQEVAGNRIEIVVEDNGIGFEQIHADKLFTPFGRLVGRSQFDGAGIGLTICKRVVERHHGAISATSQPGVGSKFIVTLPLSPG